MSQTTIESSGSTVTLDVVFSTLSHPTRRRILSKIGERDPRQSIELQPQELGEPDDEQERSHLDLYHTHLPKLDAAGFIIWEQETKTIAKGPRYEEIRPLISLMDDHQEELPADWP